MVISEPPRSRHHRPGDREAGVVGAHRVDVDDPLPFGRPDLEDVAEHREAGAVDEHVDAAHLPLRGGDHRFDRVGYRAPCAASHRLSHST
jgi:hypothetical protein